jgi:hypothetical protein
MTSQAKFQRILMTLPLVCFAFAQETPGVLRGTWTATAGPSQAFRGAWSAEISARTPNAAQGSWTLFNESGEVTLSGTWSAKKTQAGWEGTWSARSTLGRSFSGAWDADILGTRDKTFADMLRHTLEKEIAGFWRSDRYRGNWWLKGQNAKSAAR